MDRARPTPSGGKVSVLHEPPVLPSDGDRCDACAAAAVASVRLSNGAVLMMCGSHARRHRASLVSQGGVLNGLWGWPSNRSVQQVPDGQARLPQRRRWWRRMIDNIRRRPAEGDHEQR